jgi:hypothetical protein
MGGRVITDQIKFPDLQSVETRLGDLALATKIPSRNIAEQLITDAPPQIKEGTTGFPAFKYLRKVTA